MAEHNQSWEVKKTPKFELEDRCVELTRLSGGIHVLNFKGDGHHWFTPTTIHLIDELLDQLALDAGACALITTNKGKFFSNGMDVNYMRGSDPQASIEYLQMFHKVVIKILTLCVPTIAVIRGHAVGAGCLFALAHDYRIMSSSRGYIFMNEVDLGMSLTPGIMSVLRSKLPIFTFQQVVLTGKRYDGKSAMEAGIVHATYTKGHDGFHQGMRIAMEYKAKNWNPRVYQALKMEMFQATVNALEFGGIGFAKM